MGPLHWELGVLATGPPEKSLSFFVSIWFPKKLILFIHFWLGWVFVTLCRLSLVVVLELLIAVFFCFGAWALDTLASIIATVGLTCPLECEIFLNQGSNSCSQH